MLENLRNNKPIRQGVVVPNAMRVQSYEAMQSQVLINYFFANTTEQQSPDNPQSHHQNSQLEHRLQDRIEHQGERLVMNTNNLEGILQDLISKPIGIHGAVLVSSEGLAMTHPMGIDEKTSGMLSGAMIYLAQNTQTALNWQEIELISMKAQEGYVILSRCHADVYLLIQSGKVPIGLLEGEISQTISKLRSALTAVEDSSVIVQSALKPQNFLPIEGRLEEPLDLANEVTYRGRRASS
jgi:predicted regulator of Ras-like GTPase activity (Roadblock/LC7/MglB family)